MRGAALLTVPVGTVSLTALLVVVALVALVVRALVAGVWAGHDATIEQSQPGCAGGW